MQIHVSPDNYREYLLEVLVFLFLIVPPMVLSFFVIRQGNLGFHPLLYASDCRGPPTVVPLPGAALLFGAGLLRLVAYRRRKSASES